MYYEMIQIQLRNTGAIGTSINKIGKFRGGVEVPSAERLADHQMRFTTWPEGGAVPSKCIID